MVFRLNHLLRKAAYHPQWTPNPGDEDNKVGSRSLDVDNHGNVYVSGFELSTGSRRGVWSINKFNSAGQLVYHQPVYDGHPRSTGSSRGQFTFVLDNKVFHLGDLESPTITQDNPSGDFFTNSFLISTDTSGTFNSYRKKRLEAGFQEFSDVLEIKNFSTEKYVVYKQLGDRVAIEMRKSTNSSIVWSKTIKRGYYFGADRMCITADNKIQISATSHPSYKMLYDYGQIPGSMYFMKLDSTGNLVEEKTHPIPASRNFKSLQLYANRDTNTIYVYKKYDETNNKDNALHFHNIDRAAGAFGSSNDVIGSVYTPVEGKQTFLIPEKGDSALHLQSRSFPPFNNPYHNTLYGLYTFKNNTYNGTWQNTFLSTGLTIIVHDMGWADSTSIVVLGRNRAGEDILSRYDTRARTLLWTNTLALGYRIDMLHAGKDNVYLTGAKGRDLVIRQINLSTGHQQWEKVFSENDVNRSFVALNHAFNAFRNHYTIVGYIADSTGILPVQDAFYITLDSNGTVIKRWVEKGDFVVKNSLKAIEVSQLGQTLIGGALYKAPHGRSGVLIRADSAFVEEEVECDVPKPTITQLAFVLKSSAPTGNQWYFNGDSIPGASSQILNVNSSGIYNVRVTENDCTSEMSQNFMYTGLVTIDSALRKAVKIFPNPVPDFLHIENKELRSLTIWGYNSWGNLVHQSRTQDREIVIDVRTLGRGLYNFVIRDENTGQKITFRVMKL